MANVKERGNLPVSALDEIEGYVFGCWGWLHMTYTRFGFYAGKFFDPARKSFQKVRPPQFGDVGKPMHMNAYVLGVFERPRVGWWRRRYSGIALWSSYPLVKPRLEEAPKLFAHVFCRATRLLHVDGDEVGKWEPYGVRDAGGVP
jgi:hypothetical protein